MKLIITDTSNIWDERNAFLEEYRNSVLAVCLYGRGYHSNRLLDKYECFLSPIKYIGLGEDEFGEDDHRFRFLMSAKKELEEAIGEHEDIVFLADNEPTTLYPYYIMRDYDRARLHLIAVPPMKFEFSRRKKAYYELLSDLTGLRSIAYYDPDKRIDYNGITLIDALNCMTNDIGSVLPNIFDEIAHMEKWPCFYDFDSKKYIAVEGKDDLLKNTVLMNTPNQGET